MRIAVSGAHRTGKTTLVSALTRFLPTYDSIDEPYHQLEEEGHVFAEVPSIEDFELQLERCVEAVLNSREDCLLDRCPCDLLAYLITHEDAAAFDVQPWLSRVQEAMQWLDLVAFVPIEEPDRVPEAASDHGAWRRHVDDEIRSFLVEDSWGFAIPTLEVTGTPEERVQQVLKHIERDGSA